jgi:hypothetical protein
MATRLTQIPEDEVPSLTAEDLESMSYAELLDEAAYVATKIRAARALRDPAAENRLLEAERTLDDELRARVTRPVAADPFSPASFFWLGFGLNAMPQRRI